MNFLTTDETQAREILGAQPVAAIEAWADLLHSIANDRSVAVVARAEIPFFTTIPEVMRAACEDEARVRAYLTGRRRAA